MRLVEELKANYLSQLQVEILSGFLSGTITVYLCISMAALIFNCALKLFLPYGISMAFSGAFVVGLFVSLFSSFPGTVAGPQSATSVIIAVGITSIYNPLYATNTSTQMPATIVGFVMLASVAVGIFFLFLGYFKLGRFVRFIPYPVLAGFLAATGWMIFKGAFTVMTGALFQIADIPHLFTLPMLIKWVPGVIFAILLLFANRTVHKLVLMPALLISAVLLFFITLKILRVPMEHAASLGIVLKPFSESSLWMPEIFSNLTEVDWPVLLGQKWTIATIIWVGVISLLLNVTSLELVTENDIDLDRELRAAGLGNFVSGVCGGLVGYQILGASALNSKLGARTRIAGLIPLALCGIILFWGGRILSYCPIPLIGGYLLFLGISFLMEWLYESWFKLQLSDYLIVVMIFITVIFIGFIEGMGIGLLAAIVIFVLKYSRINAVKHMLSGKLNRSNVERSPFQYQFLENNGDHILIFRLQGYLFFGTAYNLFSRVKDQIDLTSQNPSIYVLVDFQEVHGLDSSAIHSLIKIERLAKNNGKIKLILTHIKPEFLRPMNRSGLLTKENRFILVAKDLDRGLEWCENQIIKSLNADASEHGLLDTLRSEIFSKKKYAERFISYLKRINLSPREFLFHKGDSSNEIYFIESGQLSVVHERENKNWIRYRKIGSGTLVGEMGYYTKTPRSASVIAAEPSYIYQLTENSIKKMEGENPVIAFEFQNYVIKLLSRRLNQKSEEIATLLY